MNKSRVFIGIYALLIISFIGCFDVPEEIILPEWDVDLNVPIANRTYTLYDMFKPESQSSIISTLSGDNFYLIKTEEYKSSTNVADYSKLVEQTSVFRHFIVPANAPDQAIYVSFPDEIGIERARFENGYLIFAITNPSNGLISSKIKVPGIIKPDGNELIIDAIVNSLGSDSIVYDLSNHEYVRPVNQPMQNNNSMQFVASANSPVWGAYQNLDLYLSKFRFRSITGALQRKDLGRKRTATLFNLNDMGNYRDKFFIKEGTLLLQSNYKSTHNNPFEIEVRNIQLIGKRNSGDTKILKRNDGQNINFRINNGQHDLTLNEVNSNLTEFITFLPDSIIITTDYILNPDDVNLVRTIDESDSIDFSLQFSTKSIFAVKQANYTDTLEINFNAEERDKIRKGVNADLSIHLENAIPIDAYIKVTLTDENYQPLVILSKGQNNSDSLRFLGGQVNSSNGAIIAPTTTQNLISLIDENIQKFSNARFAIISVTVNTTNTNPGSQIPPYVQFKSSDWLKLRCFGKVKYHVNN